MTDRKTRADGVRDPADDSPHAHRAPVAGRWTEVLMHRWPTALGIAVAALAAYDMDLDEDIGFLSPLIVVMALVYVGAAALDRRWSAWVVLLAGLAVAFFIPPTSGIINPSVVLLFAAAVFLVVGVALGRLRKPGGLTLQAAGVLAFGATALAALYVDLDLGAYLVAFAILAHAAWDAYHYLRDSVVSRPYAELCCALDLVLGAAILVMA